MDADIITRKSRGKKQTELLVFPDADVSNPENESDSDIEAKSESHKLESSESEAIFSTNDGVVRISNDDNIPLANLTTVSKGPYKWQKRCQIRRKLHL